MNTAIMKRLETAEQKVRPAGLFTVIVTMWTSEEVDILEKAIGENFSDNTAQDYRRIINIHYVETGDKPGEPLVRPARPLDELLADWYKCKGDKP
jgi:hypothetical protein